MWSCSSVLQAGDFCLLERGEREHARIVDEDVERPERRHCFGKQPLHLGDDGDIRLNRDRVAACGLDIGDDAPCTWSVSREVHDDGGTRGCHRLRDAGSNALARAGDEHNLTRQGTGHRRAL